MTGFCAAFDNIRLIRKKIQIENVTLRQGSFGAERDMALARVVGLSEDLIRALNDFADLGFEARVAAMIAQSHD